MHRHRHRHRHMQRQIARGQGGTFLSATTGRPLSTQTVDRMTWLALISVLSHARLCSSGAAKDGTAEAADSASEPSPDPPSCFNRNASRDSMACRSTVSVMLLRRAAQHTCSWLCYERIGVYCMYCMYVCMHTYGNMDVCVA